MDYYSILKKIWALKVKIRHEETSMAFCSSKEDSENKLACLKIPAIWQFSKDKTRETEKTYGGGVEWEKDK